jgi:hypothetical protein
MVCFGRTKPASPQLGQMTFMGCNEFIKIHAQALSSPFCHFKVKYHGYEY